VRRDRATTPNHLVPPSPAPSATQVRIWFQNRRQRVRNHNIPKGKSRTTSALGVHFHAIPTPQVWTMPSPSHTARVLLPFAVPSACSRPMPLYENGISELRPSHEYQTPKPCYAMQCMLPGSSSQSEPSSPIEQPPPSDLTADAALGDREPPLPSRLVRVSGGRGGLVAAPHDVCTAEERPMPPPPKHQREDARLQTPDSFIAACTPALPPSPFQHADPSIFSLLPPCTMIKDEPLVKVRGLSIECNLSIDDLLELID
jgi:hypothetical protein